jgi:AP-3 complex subunit delta-1
MDIVKRFMQQIDDSVPANTATPTASAISSDPAYREEIVKRVIDLCSEGGYQHIVRFDWYIAVLVDLARVKGVRKGPVISAQLIDVSVRVRIVRKYSAQLMVSILSNLFLDHMLS